MFDLDEDQQQLLQESIAILREDAVRITDQRKAILSYLIKTDSHPTAEGIYEVIRKEVAVTSLATIYNNLNLFASKGLVKKIKAKDEAIHFDFFMRKHYHVICESCGRIVDLYYPQINQFENYAEEKTGFQIRSHAVEIYGICPQCQLKQQNAQINE